MSFLFCLFFYIRPRACCSMSSSFQRIAIGYMYIHVTMATRLSEDPQLSIQPFILAFTRSFIHPYIRPCLHPSVVALSLAPSAFLSASHFWLVLLLQVNSIWIRLHSADRHQRILNWFATRSNINGSKRYGQQWIYVTMAKSTHI